MKSTELVDRIKAGETVKLGPYKLALQGSTENRAILGIEHENGTYEELNMNDGLITAKSMFGPGRHSITTDDELKQALQSSVGLEEEGKKTMKLTQEQLTEMVRKIVKDSFDYTGTIADLESKELDLIKAWVDGDFEDLPPELLGRLTNMHVDEMPLDVQQGNTGTPDEWLRAKMDSVFYPPKPGRALEENKTVKLTQEKLKEMIRKVVKAKLNEADDGTKDMPDAWVKYMKEVEDLFGETIKKMNDLADKGEEIMHGDRELDKVANPINSARSNHHEFVKERSEAVKELASTLARRLEAWKTRY